MDHWCAVPELENIPHANQKYISIPEDSPGVYSSCDVFNLNYSIYSMEDFRDWNRTAMTGEDTPVTSCQQWVYDKSEFVSSAVSEVGYSFTSPTGYPYHANFFAGCCE